MIVPHFKTGGINEELLALGYRLSYEDNVGVITKIDGGVIDEPLVQTLLDNYSALPYAQAEAIKSVKSASATKRLEFVTQAAGKDAEYTFKATEAAQFDIDGSVGIFMQARITTTGETAATVAAEWNAKNVGWKAVGAAIAAIEDKSSQDINAETDWTQCQVIAATAIAQIEAIL